MKYRDLDIFFRKNIDTRDISTVSENSAIIQSIKNLVLTRPLERPFSNMLGTETIDYLFETPTSAEIAFLQLDIFNMLKDFEPRILVQSVEVIYPTSAGTTEDLKINIEFSLAGQQDFTAPRTVTFTVAQ